VILLTKISFDGKLEDAEHINIGAYNESWNTYELEDGTELRVKLVLVSVLRLKDKYSKTGEPVYVVKTEVAIDTRAPDELIKLME